MSTKVSYLSITYVIMVIPYRPSLWRTLPIPLSIALKGPKKGQFSRDFHDKGLKSKLETYAKIVIFCEN